MIDPGTPSRDTETRDGGTWGPGPVERAPVTSMEHKECSTGGVLETAFSETFPLCNPDGSPDPQRDQRQRWLHLAWERRKNATQTHKSHLPGPVQERSSLMGREGLCLKSGLDGGRGKRERPGRVPPARFLAPSRCPVSGSHWDLAVMPLCSQQATVPSLGEGTETHRGDANLAKMNT